LQSTGYDDIAVETWSSLQRPLLNGGRSGQHLQGLFPYTDLILGQRRQVFQESDRRSLTETSLATETDAT